MWSLCHNIMHPAAATTASPPQTHKQPAKVCPLERPWFTEDSRVSPPPTAELMMMACLVCHMPQYVPKSHVFHRLGPSFDGFYEEPQQPPNNLATSLQNQRVDVDDFPSIHLAASLNFDTLLMQKNRDKLDKRFVWRLFSRPRLHIDDKMGFNRFEFELIWNKT